MRTLLSTLYEGSKVMCGIGVLCAGAAAAAQTAPAVTPAPGAQAAEATRLEVGKPIEREIGGGQTQRYLIHLDAGQLLRGVVEQKGVDVAVALVGPDGKTLLEVDSPNGANGPEPVLVLAETSGDYTLEVKQLDPADKGGHYEARVDEVRAATERDRQLAEATKLLGQSVLFSAAGKSREAIPLAERAVAQYEKALGPDHPDVANSLNNLADLYQATGAYAKAEPLYVRALAIKEKALGPDHPDVAISLNGLAEMYRATGAYAKAEPLYVRAQAILEKALGPDHPDVAISLNNLADLYQATGAYAKAEPLYVRALAIKEKALGSDHPDVAISLNSLAELYRATAAYAKAEPLYVRALAILEKALGPDHPNLAFSLNNLAEMYRATGAYAKAEPLYVRALAILEKALGPDHPDVANSLNNLADLYQATGAYAKAEPLYVMALAIKEKALGPDHPDVATALNNLADLYRATGAYAKAEPLYVRALAIKEKALGPDHPDVALSLNSLAELYRATGAYAKAEPLYVRALAINEKALGPNHPYVAASLNNLAELYRATGAYAKAEPLYVRAQAIDEKALGSDHPDVAISLNNLAEVYRATGAYAKAESLYVRALAINEKVLGPDHPYVAISLNNLALLYWTTGADQKAVEYQARANDATERNLVRNLASGSEQRKLQYLATTAPELDDAVSLHLLSLPSDQKAAHVALETLLRRKGRALDAMTDAIVSIRARASPEDRTLLDELASAQAGLASSTLRGPGKEAIESHRKNLAALEERVEQLETEISSRSAEFRAQAAPVTLDSVQKAVPDGVALIEYIRYRAVAPKALAARHYDGAGHYAVYVLTSGGLLGWRDLGEAAPIDAAVNDLRAALRDPKRPDVRRLARVLDAKIFEPARRLAGPSRDLLVSPDGALNLVPFAALRDRRGRYAVERYRIQYLTSGRDLLRLGARDVKGTKSVVVADPDFGAGPGPQVGSEAFAPLSSLAGSAEEARALTGLLGTPSVRTRGDATTDAVGKVEHPEILHVSTHGYFLDGNEGGTSGDEQRIAVRRMNGSVGDTAPAMRLENPLLRSGLFFAGANASKGESSSNGVMTAAEVAGLDLWGTRLVVLSACDTGVGEVKSGDGVYGLRRALVLAGAETTMVSLWPVSDAGTRDLMIGFYKKLETGAGREDALRETQLEMLKDLARRHPYYWASFIESGAWGPINAAPAH